MTVCLYVCMSVCMLICMYVCLSVHGLIHISISRSSDLHVMDPSIHCQGTRPVSGRTWRAKYIADPRETRPLNLHSGTVGGEDLSFEEVLAVVGGGVVSLGSFLFLFLVLFVLFFFFFSLLAEMSQFASEW